ncbi:MAG: response regulator [Acidobacteria bacterium]|nr:response regulator [Acidobacteriota bacterium]
MLNGGPVRILLVEDDPAHAEIVKRNMADCRIANQLHHVADGQAALDYLYQENGYASADSAPRPDLILLDLRLPKVDGQEVLQRLKADVDLKSIPVVVLTTSKAEVDLLSAYDHGASSYLVKPVDFDKFKQMLEIFGFYWLMWNQFPHPEEPSKA